VSIEEANITKRAMIIMVVYLHHEGDN